MITLRLDRTWIACSLATLPLLVAACGDDSPSTDDGTTGMTSFTTAPPPETTTGDPDDGPVDTTEAVDETGTPDPLCDTIFCGNPAVCCGADEECVQGQCLPECDTGIRCGEDLAVCCPAGDVCLQPDCVTPGDACIDSYDCPEGWFCEPTLGVCLPSPAGGAQCQIIPDFGMIEVIEEWSNTQDDIITTPVVGDVDGDGLPEIVINTYGAGSTFFGEIVILDGTNGDVQTRITDSAANGTFGSYARSSIGLADVDDNGLPDIVYVGRPATGIPGFPSNSSLIHAVNGLGMPLWSSHDSTGNPYYIYVRQGGPSFANFDNDPSSEIVFGAAVLDNDGLVVADVEHPLDFGASCPAPCPYGGGLYGSNGASNQSGRGGISALVDLTGDDYPEIVSGQHAWSVDWVAPAVGNPTVTLTPMWVNVDGGDGYPAIADVDLDGDPEVILVSESMVRIIDGATGELWCGIDPTGAMCNANPALRTQPLPIPAPPLGGACTATSQCNTGSVCQANQCVNLNRGGPPTVADFDGDGRPEIGIAGGAYYAVFDVYRPGEDVVQPAGDPPANPGEIYVRWRAPIVDQSSHATGSSVFDFQGDGSAEVVYQDECHMRIFDGSDGTVLVEIESQSDTIREYPIVADVDGDNNSELVVVSNDLAVTATCADIYPGYTPRQGIYVYGDPNDQWVRTRRVWTQHTYHVTNATSNGLTPVQEDPNWLDPDLNNYRQNVQGEGTFNAPDLEVDLSVAGTCLDQMFEITATVRNNGALGVPMGVDVTLYEGTNTNGTLISTQSTPVALLPGASVDLVWQWMATPEPHDFFVIVDNDNGFPRAGIVSECNEDNNTSAATAVSCPVSG